MKIEKEWEGTTLILFLSGRLDINTAPLLEKEISPQSEEITELIFDMKELDYISSAGLRVLLKVQKKMDGRGNMWVCHVCEGVMDVFKITGFSDILTIKEPPEESSGII